MNEIKIKVTEYSNDGCRVERATDLYLAISCEIRAGNYVRLDFTGQNCLKFNFLIESIGRLYFNFSKEFIDKYVLLPIGASADSHSYLMKSLNTKSGMFAS